MENKFFVDSGKLSPAALEKKHRLENDPSFRTNHMEYMEGMEIIESDICEKVMSQMKAYDYDKYTARDVVNALEHETCTIEDFKALLSPAAEPYLERMAQRARIETGKHFGNTVYLFTPLYIANYCENYCVYCGFNCYNDISRMKLTGDQIEKEMRIIAASSAAATPRIHVIILVNVLYPCFFLPLFITFITAPWFDSHRSLFSGYTQYIIINCVRHHSIPEKNC